MTGPSHLATEKGTTTEKEALKQNRRRDSIIIIILLLVVLAIAVGMIAYLATRPQTKLDNEIPKHMTTPATTSDIMESIRVSLWATPHWSPARLDLGEAIVGVTLADPEVYSGLYGKKYLWTIGQMDLDVLAALAKDPELTNAVWSRGKLAQYVSGIQAARQYPRTFFGFNLVEIMHKQLNMSFDYFQANRFALSWMALALCQQNESLASQYLNILTANPGVYHFGIDEASMMTMACLCINTPATNATADAAAMYVSTQLQQDSGLNVYSLGLGAQALIASGDGQYSNLIESTKTAIRSKLDISETMKFGSAVSQILPALADTSFLAIATLGHPSPPTTTTPMIMLRITISYEDNVITNTSEQWNAQLTVPTHPTLLQAMEELQQLDNTFSFATIDTSFGPMMTTINNITAVSTSMYWAALRAPDQSLNAGVGSTYPTEGEHFIFRLQTF